MAEGGQPGERAYTYAACCYMRLELSMTKAEFGMLNMANPARPMYSYPQRGMYWFTGGLIEFRHAAHVVIYLFDQGRQPQFLLQSGPEIIARLKISTDRDVVIKHERMWGFDKSREPRVVLVLLVPSQGEFEMLIQAPQSEQQGYARVFSEETGGAPQRKLWIPPEFALMFMAHAVSDVASVGSVTETLRHKLPPRRRGNTPTTEELVARLHTEIADAIRETYPRVSRYAIAHQVASTVLKHLNEQEYWCWHETIRGIADYEELNLRMELGKAAIKSKPPPETTVDTPVETGATAQEPKASTSAAALKEEAEAKTVQTARKEEMSVQRKTESLATDGTKKKKLAPARAMSGQEIENSYRHGMTDDEWHEFFRAMVRSYEADREEGRMDSQLLPWFNSLQCYLYLMDAHQQCRSGIRHILLHILNTQYFSYLLISFSNSNSYGKRRKRDRRSRTVEVRRIGESRS